MYSVALRATSFSSGYSVVVTLCQCTTDRLFDSMTCLRNMYYVKLARYGSRCHIDRVWCNICYCIMWAILHVVYGGHIWCPGYMLSLCAHHHAAVLLEWSNKIT